MTKQHETLSIFVPSSLKNDKGDEFLLEKFKDSGVRKTEFVTFDPEVSIYNFSCDDTYVYYINKDRNLYVYNLKKNYKSLLRHLAQNSPLVPHSYP